MSCLPCLFCLGGWSRRAVLCAAAGVLVGARAATKKNPPPKAAAARQWRVALRVVRGEQGSDLVGSAHYRSDAQAQPAQMELVVAEGETARWAVSQTQSWVWTEAVWSGADTSTGSGTAGPSTAGPGAGTVSVPGSGLGRGGVVQSPHKSTQTQWLECEVLAQASAQGQKVRLRVLWQEPRVGAGESVVYEDAAVALDQVLWLVPDAWQILAQTGSGSAANPTGGRHWGTRSTDTRGVPWQLQLRLERVTP